MSSICNPLRGARPADLLHLDYGQPMEGNIETICEGLTARITIAYVRTLSSAKNIKKSHNFPTIAGEPAEKSESN